jgi:chromosome segregation protein
MRLKRLELSGFKSFAKKTPFLFESRVTAIVGPNGSGKSNSAEAFRWVLGERSLKSLRSGKGEDLIWNGGPSGVGRASRAGVTLVFDNQDRLFNVDYDEVSLGREVYRDGENVYSVNGTAVRHKDLTELLSNASLGTSDHYIINQGEADRVLAASAKERRSLVEDALGLRQYQWKIAESEKKLEQTATNIERVSSLRREIAPHLKFLKKQVEKIEQADKLRAELKQAYLEYLKREEHYLQTEKKALEQERAQPRAELEGIKRNLEAESGARENQAEQWIRDERAQLEQRGRGLAAEKEQLTRALGRLEGVLELKREQLESRPAEERDFTHAEVSNWVRDLEREIDQAGKFSDIFSIKSALSKLRESLQHFLSRGTNAGDLETKEAEIKQLESERESLTSKVAEISKAENELEQEKKNLDQKLADTLAAARSAEREVYELKSRRQELEGILNLLDSRASRLNMEEANFARELAEAKVLVNQEVVLYREYIVVFSTDGEPREKQLERQKHLERLKIKLEDLGVETGDTMKEYRETSERDEYLAKELVDLEQAETGLRQLIAELTAKIDQEFRLGLVKINHQFQEFFALMFGGGTAKLTILEYKPKKMETEEGVVTENDNSEGGGLEIDVSLPRKRIRGLEMLSGGERALVSIALLFALSQVNPPPFLVLDETDAALDEANSRKYGEMVESLSKHSQLILITHNRETMSRAGVIYGVTMGSDGISKLLSIKFDEAAGYAK